MFSLSVQKRIFIFAALSAFAFYFLGLTNTTQHDELVIAWKWKEFFWWDIYPDPVILDC